MVRTVQMRDEAASEQLCEQAGARKEVDLQSEAGN